MPKEKILNLKPSRSESIQHSGREYCRKGRGLMIKITFSCLIVWFGIWFSWDKERHKNQKEATKETEPTEEKGSKQNVRSSSKFNWQIKGKQ